MIRKRILIVDDDPMYLTLLAKGFSADRYEVNEASTARQALKYVEDKNIDLIICDVSLPDFSGISLAAKAKAMFGKEIPFVFISAYPIHEMIAQNAQLIKDHNFFQKPFNLQLLVDKVYSIVSL